MNGCIYDDDLMALIRAREDGKTIQTRQLIPLREWSDVSPGRWNFIDFEYRIKPSPPKPREWWIFPMSKDAKGRELFELGTQVRSQGMMGVIHVREVLPDEEGK